jgi:hypothetical protein
MVFRKKLLVVGVVLGAVFLAASCQQAASNAVGAAEAEKTATPIKVEEKTKGEKTPVLGELFTSEG